MLKLPWNGPANLWWLQKEHQSPPLKHTVEKQKHNHEINIETCSVNMRCRGNVMRIKDNILDKPKRWVSFHGRSWWGSSFPCNDLPPVKHKHTLLWHQWRSQSCKIMETRLTWSKCNPTMMYGFTASLCTASRKSTWPMSEKIRVKGGQTMPLVVIAHTPHVVCETQASLLRRECSKRIRKRSKAPATYMMVSSGWGSWPEANWMIFCDVCKNWDTPVQGLCPFWPCDPRNDNHCDD